ncbi:DUF4302 domain-containing protein [Prevotella sp. PCHR]|uniref:DUF4302 domain-containing protein n=1 Tax=Xylanibacter caecicola TaxID=2736294 RepID=A0ABX2B1P3_9BACT|nr:DUF4302 domain-containing protein [Xylanibacter caecicola]NPE24034.1 DUF4302 domain-containing protein [Xylanibacter caecicola]
MKKIFYFSLLVASALTFSSCTHEEDDIFDKSAAEILNEVSELYSERLASSEGGWAIEYYPTIIEDFDPTVDNQYQVQGYLLLADFNKDGSVNMGMKNIVSGNRFISDRSAWDVITDLGPVLSFSTYNNCIHPFAQPEESGVLDTDKGKGLEGDYEFMMLDVPENPEYIMLKGKKRGTYVRMSRLDADTDFASYYSNLDALNGKYFNPSAPNNLVMTLGETAMNVKDAGTGLITTWPVGGDEVADAVIRPFLTFVHNGEFRLRFRDAIELEDGSTAQEFAYNEEDDVFHGLENNDFTIAGPDANAFVYSYITDKHKIQWDRQSESAGQMKDVYENVYQGFRKLNYTLSNVQILNDVNNGLVCRVSYRTNRGTSATLNYKFSMELSDGAVTFKYIEPVGTSGNVLNTIPSLLDMLNALSSSFTASKSETGFDLTKTKLTSSANPNDWFVVTLIN